MQMGGAGGGSGPEARGSLGNPVINAIPTYWSRDNWLHVVHARTALDTPLQKKNPIL